MVSNNDGLSGEIVDPKIPTANISRANQEPDEPKDRLPSTCRILVRRPTFWLGLHLLV